MVGRGPVVRGPPGPTGVAGLSTQFGCTYATINDAILAAPTGATIYVTPNVSAYHETWNLIANKDLRIEPAANANCHTGGSGRVTVDATTGGRLATISNGSLTLRNVDVRDGFVNTALGGGQFRLVNSDLVLDNATLRYGDAGIGPGGAVRVDGGSTMTMLAGSQVSDGEATVGGGVAIDPGGSLTVGAGAEMRDNYASGAGGGAVYVDGGTVTVASGATLWVNRSYGGGSGISAVGGSTVEVGGMIIGSLWHGVRMSGGTLNLLPGAAITDTSWEGGVVCLGCALTATGATLADNIGGGLYADGVATVTLTDTTISGNTAETGAGIYTGAVTTLTNVTVSGNVADLDGGGVYCLWCDLVAVDSRFVGNVANAGAGGGICTSAPAARATLALVDSVIDGNEANGALAGGGLFLADTDAVLNNVDVVRNLDWGVGVTSASVMTACNGTSWATGVDDNAPNDVIVDLAAVFDSPGAQSMVCDATLGTCDLTPVGCPL